MNKLQISCNVIHGHAQVIHDALSAVSLLQTNQPTAAGVEVLHYSGQCLLLTVP